MQARSPPVSADPGAIGSLQSVVPLIRIRGVPERRSLAKWEVVPFTVLVARSPVPSYV